MALTADGKTASRDGRLHTFGTEADHRNLLELRVPAGAILCGAGTIRAAPITLLVRDSKWRARRRAMGLTEEPLRIVVSGSGRVNPGAEVFRHRKYPLHLWVTERARPRMRQLEALADRVAVFGEKSLDWSAALSDLKRHWGVTDLLCEGGGRVNGALFEAGLVDEVHLTLCPLLLGGDTSSTLADGSFASSLDQGRNVQWTESCVRDGQLFLTGRVTK